MNKGKARGWIIGTLLTLIVLLTLMAALTYIVDPYFHFHAPYAGIKYRLYEQRYVNDGIGRNFAYDAIITGNSLSENFKTSEFDRLFGTESVKLPYSGAGYKEIWESLDRAMERNGGVKQVLVALDYDDLVRDKDWVRYEDYPDYLYDDSLFNDVSYLWNKDVFYHGTLYNLMMTLRGQESTTFDEYSSWEHETGGVKVMSQVDRIMAPSEIGLVEYTAEDEETVRQNIRQNIISVVEKYPDTQFMLFFAPSSIAQWCIWNNQSKTPYHVLAEQTAIEELLSCPQISLYCFFEKEEWICDLDNYSDTLHYTTAINSEILSLIAEGEYEITEENYQEHIEKTMEFYTGYDYLSLSQYMEQ
jgi:hypothetical protein